MIQHVGGTKYLNTCSNHDTTKKKNLKKKLIPIIREEGTNVEVSVLDSVCLQRKNSNNYGRDERGRKEEREGEERGRERRETGEVIWWKEDLPHHIHTHLSSDRILKEREKRRDQSFPQSSF